MKAVILAAGMGTRMGDRAKPLLPLFGIPIIEHTVKKLKKQGVGEIAVVYNDPMIEKYFKRKHPDIYLIRNDSPNRENGFSLYLARNWVDGNFLLLMGDHYFSNSFFHNMDFDGTTLLVSKKCIDEDEATKVRVSGDLIVDMGKGIENYDYFDTGFFYCTREVFDYAENLVGNEKIVKISQIMGALARDGKLKYSVIDDFWADIDTKDDLKIAEKKIERNLVKHEDGYIARYVNRRISIKMSKFLARWDFFSPNTITTISLLLGILTAILFQINFILGGILAQVTSIFDGCDGEIARLKWMTTEFGRVFDALSDRYVDILIILSIYLLIPYNTIALISFFLSVTGVIFFSYSYHMSGVRVKIGGRDVRLFLIFLFSILSLIYSSLLLYLLFLIGFITHLGTIASLVMMKNKGGEGIRHINS